MSSATDELRRLLDERGVKWDYGITGATSTRFSANGVDVTFVPMRYGLICSTILTPAQVVKVMLGRGECRDAAGEKMGFFACSACGGTDMSKNPEFCHWCGRQVKR